MSSSYENTCLMLSYVTSGPPKITKLAAWNAKKLILSESHHLSLAIGKESRQAPRRAARRRTLGS